MAHTRFRQAGRPHVRWRCALALTVTMFAVVAANRAAAQQSEYFEPAARQIRMTVQGQRDGSHLQRLFALRRLNDPSLDTMFSQLLRHAEWQVQVHAILGLAENSPARQLDPWLVTQLKPEGQDAAIATALDLDLINEAGIRELLAWDGLLPMSRLLLIAELVLLDTDVPRDALATLSENPDARIAGLASALLLQEGVSDRFSAYQQRLGALPPSERERVLAWLFEVIRQYELSALGPWLVEQLSSGDNELNERTRHAGLFAALHVAPQQAEACMRRELSTNLRTSTRVRLMQMVLTTKPVEPRWMYDMLLADSPLLDAMHRIGTAQVDQRPEIDAIKALIDLNHPRSMQWCIEYAAQRMDDDEAIVIFRYVLDRSNRGEPVPPGLVIAAATEYYERRPDELLTHLLEVEDDSAHQELLLLALLDVHDDRAAQAAHSLRRIGSGRADSLALLLAATGGTELDDTDLRHLGLIAAGGGRVAAGLQAQAAWQYLKRTDETEPALARAFN